MDVIGAGFGRTGTLSLKLALERLGFGPCLHMRALLDDPERAALFRRAAGHEPGALGKAMQGYRSTVDWPGAYFWRALVTANPQAKVILTVRDPRTWYASAHRTIYQASRHAAGDMIDTVVWDGTFAGRFTDRDHAIRVFREHAAAVRREVPAHRLLEVQVSQGWAPICGFLGVPVPPEDFPHVNDTASFQEQVAGRRR
ncbi:sulfotransferase family protein [Actinoplanes sp. TFC3]|uniref:sulfotransferase family protein n=1 Tax=Actinoplanes sp. TFC3 TaxID=1710355 RepID=UPI00083450D3|nr:sulfotransferase family protein [Actinoplanes sp. TFC3]